MIDKANLGGTGGEPVDIAENIMSTLNKAHPLMDAGDVLAVIMTFNITQSAVTRSKDDMRNEIIRNLRAIATHLAS